MTDGMAKIRLKGGPKDYKRGPGPTGAQRLHKQVNRLLLSASRLQRKETGDRAYAAALTSALQTFVALWQPPTGDDDGGDDGHLQVL